MSALYRDECIIESKQQVEGVLSGESGKSSLRNLCWALNDLEWITSFREADCHLRQTFLQAAVAQRLPLELSLGMFERRVCAYWAEM